MAITERIEINRLLCARVHRSGTRVNKKEYKAKVLGSDPYADIAVLKIESNDVFIVISSFVSSFSFFVVLFRLLCFSC